MKLRTAALGLATTALAVAGAATMITGAAAAAHAPADPSPNSPARTAAPAIVHTAPSAWQPAPDYSLMAHPGIRCSNGRTGPAEFGSAYGDVTGDGKSDAIITLGCWGGADVDYSPQNEIVEVFSGGVAHLRYDGTLGSTRTNREVLRVINGPSTLTVESSAYSGWAGNRDLLYKRSYYWQGDHFVVGPQANVLHACAYGSLSLPRTQPKAVAADRYDYAVLDFVNHLPQPCTIAGYPTVHAFDGSHHIIATAVQTESGPKPGPGAVSTITVPAGKHLHAVVVWSPENSHGTACTTASTTGVTPPQGAATGKRYNLQVTTCNLRVHSLALAA